MILFFGSDSLMAENLRNCFDKEVQIVRDETDLTDEYAKAECFIVDEEADFCKKWLAKGFQGRILLLLSKDKKEVLSSSLPPEVLLISKPFYLRDLKKQVETVLKQASLKEISFSGYVLDPWLKTLSGEKLHETVKLTEKEVDLLQYLCQKQESPVLKETLLEKVWEYSPEMTTHTLETHIYNLRQKMHDEEGRILQNTEDGYCLKI